MKKITFLLSALVLAFTVNATPINSLKQNVERKQIAPVSLEQVATTAVRKAPAGAKSTISDLTVEQTGNGLLEFHWNGDASYYLVGVYAIDGDDQIKIVTFNYQASLYANWATENAAYGMSTDNLLYYAAQGYTSLGDDAADYIHNNYYLIPGDYLIDVVGNDTENLTDDGLSEVGTIISYDVTGYNVEINADRTKATITFNELDLPANYFYGVQIYNGSTAIVNNIASLKTSNPTLVHSPIEIDVEEGNTYSVWIAVLELYNGGLYYGSDNLIDETFTVGTNPNVPENLKATVLDGENAGSVLLEWTSQEAAPAYVVFFYTEDGEEYAHWEYSNGNTYNYLTTTEQSILVDDIEPGTYQWSVQALDADYYTSTDEIFGENFTILDTPTALDVHTTTVEDGDLFNVLGQRVDASYKGIVIKNGKKVLVR